MTASVVHFQAHRHPNGLQQTQQLWLILSLRIGLFLVELAAGLWSHSLSILAGAGHLFSDLIPLALTLLMVGLVQWQDLDRSTSWYRQREGWIALLNGISLVSIALTLAWEAIEHLQAPEPLLGLPMLIAAGLSLMVNGFSIYLLHEDSHHSLNLRGIVFHGIADAVSSIGALLSSLAVYFAHWLWADAIVSLLVALLISISALSLIRDGYLLMTQRAETPRHIMT